jgi:hypothetical protein
MGTEVSRKARRVAGTWESMAEDVRSGTETEKGV